jgi:hypothetical protein
MDAYQMGLAGLLVAPVAVLVVLATWDWLTDRS